MCGIAGILAVHEPKQALGRMLDAMRHSLEVRAPFTDHIFLSAVLGISSRERCRRIPDKPREYAVMKPLLGPEYVRRRKQGFIFPFEIWLQHEDVVRSIEATFQDAAHFQNAGLAPELPSRLYSLYRNAPAPRLWSRVWLLYVFTRWCLVNRITAA